MVYIGRNTYSIMMHHAACFMLVKGFFYLCSLYTPLCREFDAEMFFGEIGFVYLAGGAEASKWIYLLAGIGLPLGISEVQHRIGQKIAKVREKTKDKR